MLRMDCPKFLQSTRFPRGCGSIVEGLCARFEVLLIHPLLKCGGKLARHELEVQALDQRVEVLVFLLQTEG